MDTPGKVMITAALAAVHHERPSLDLSSLVKHMDMRTSSTEWHDSIAKLIAAEAEKSRRKDESVESDD
jgi:hypothetical protein